MENTKKTILVVEDELALRQVLVENLVSENYNVLQAINGAEGLSMALSNHPDLILLDILMPVMNGLNMMKELRAKDDYGKRVPIILLTVLSPNEEEIIKHINEEEPAFYLIKTDWKIKEVVEKVKERLNRTI